MNKSTIESLKFYFQNSAELDPGIAEKVSDVFDEILEMIAADEEAAKHKRKSPNKTGVVQLDPETNAIVGMYLNQKLALIAIGKEGKSGIGDAINGRVKTHKAYGYLWYFKDEYEEAFGPIKNWNPVTE